jgi:ubiquinone/menaquinone biosynthesis C-methylase UbiE
LPALAERSAPPDAFGNTAREYELGRPRWPQELIDRVVRELELTADATVLDLGAGTGKLARDLVPRFARVLAVEPDGAMRDVLEEVVPEAEALAGSAEAIPLDTRSVDAVFSAEAFHWFASDETVAEIARVLRPRGGFAIFWNIEFGEPEPSLGEAVDSLLDEAFARGGSPGLPRVLSGAWRKPLERSSFGPLHEATIEREVVRERERWLATMLSVSSIASQSDEERLALATRLRELVPDVEYRWRIRTVAYWTRLEAQGDGDSNGRGAT